MSLNLWLKHKKSFETGARSFHVSDSARKVKLKHILAHPGVGRHRARQVMKLKMKHSALSLPSLPPLPLISLLWSLFFSSPSEYPLAASLSFFLLRWSLTKNRQLWAQGQLHVRDDRFLNTGRLAVESWPSSLRRCGGNNETLLLHPKTFEGPGLVAWLGTNRDSAGLWKPFFFFKSPCKFEAPDCSTVLVFWKTRLMKWLREEQKSPRLVKSSLTAFKSRSFSESALLVAQPSVQVYPSCTSRTLH